MINKVAGIGVIAGVAGLVSAPYTGAKENGVTGFIGGVASGAVGAVVCTVGVAVMGATQVCRGIANTPDACMQSSNRVWDPHQGCWIDDTVNLREAINETMAEDSSDESGDEEGTTGGVGEPIRVQASIA